MCFFVSRSFVLFSEEFDISETGITGVVPDLFCELAVPAWLAVSGSTVAVVIVADNCEYSRTVIVFVIVHDDF
jgi:hypothetical protein